MDQSPRHALNGRGAWQFRMYSLSPAHQTDMGGGAA